MIKKFEKFNEPKITIDYYPNGQKKVEWWELNGKYKYHREDGPAYQKWYKNGQKRLESWYLNDKRHRENGPAYQSWYGNGQKESEYWFLNNKIYTKDRI